MIFVRDNGVGFDMAYGDKLFGVFQRLHRADEFEGTGIGLANVHRIINQHGGQVWAKAKVEQGATFYFALPQVKGDLSINQAGVCIMSEPYTITSTLYKEVSIELCRALRRRDGAAVIIKIVSDDESGPGQTKRLHNEYKIMQRLDSPYVLRAYELDRQKTQSWLILEDFDGEPLSGLLDQPIEIDRFLDIARQLVAALVDIHQQDIIHKDLNPAHILVQPETGAIKLTGFGIASRLLCFPTIQGRGSFIGGSLAYMSPERIGYLNWGIDHRSDLYSLGIIFYQLLTGKLPFKAADPLEWGHCHVARLPRSPLEIAPAIPKLLADIVLKLLEKHTNKRYQSARGLLEDLKHCRELWTTKGKIVSFPLGQQDGSNRFLISPKLYGREKELATLTENFKQMTTTGHTRFMLVSGYSGIGKSALVQALRWPVVEAKGYFISGKFDQYQRDIPYVTLVQAFCDLIQQILTESDECIQTWKVALKTALGTNGQIIIDLIPQLERIIGLQPPAPVLPPTEAKHRFHLVFHRFVGVFAHKDHPLVLFLDDLQWLDPASLKLMAYLVTRTDPQALFLIGAYRDNEVNPSHPLMPILNEIYESDVSPQELVLGPLSFGDLTQLVADTLLQPINAVTPLVKLVYGKTAGNPFFAIQFLTTLHQEGLITYNEQDARWHWDLPAIQQYNFTDNIVDLMLGKLKRFSAKTQQTLMLAACLGNVAEVCTLALLCNLSEEQLHSALKEAIDEGLLCRLNSSYKFLHDRVQEAAYALLPEDKRPAKHLHIGGLLLSHTPDELIDRNIFKIVGQLNRGTTLITKPSERNHLAKLNLAAGKRAKAATAYASAIHYFAAGTALLSSKAWESTYDLAFNLHLEQAECEYLVGSFEHSDQLLTAALDQARFLLDRVLVYRRRQRLYQLSGRFHEAITVTLEVLHLLGILLPESDEGIRAAFEEENLLVSDNLHGRPIADLAKIPLTDDGEARVLIGLLAEASPLIYTARPLLWPLITAKGVNLSLQRGHADESPFIYSCYTMVLVGVCRDIPTALKFSEMALQLSDRLPGAAAWKGKVMFHDASVVGIWGRHFAENLPLLNQAFHACIDSGDLVHASYLTYNAIWLHLENGEPLDQIVELACSYEAFARQNHNDIVCNVNQMEKQFALCLQGRTRSETNFSDASFEEADCIAAIDQSGFRLGRVYYHIMKLLAAYFAGQYDDALKWAERTEPMLLQVSSMANEATCYFYHALTLTALYEHSSTKRQREFMGLLGDILQKLKYWADNCPENFANRYILVLAEVARLEKRDQDAMKLYEQAIASARKNGFIHNEAVAYEVAASFYRQRGYEKFARTYLTEATTCYFNWGALGKVRQLERLNPWLTVTQQPQGATLTEHVEAVSLAKAQQAISSEISLERLAQTLLRIIMESAGAQTGLLSVEGAGRLRAEMQWDNNDNQQIVFNASPLAENIPEAIVNYVRRCRDTVILDDAGAHAGEFSADDYLSRVKPKSVLCMAIQRQDKLFAVLYLENNLVTGAFTFKRRSLLEMLAAQASIYLEISNVYEALQESEERYRMVFENSSISIWEEDFSAVKTLFCDLKKRGVVDIENYFDQDPEAVRRCAELVRIIDVNRAALTLHGAADKEELLAGLANTFTPESFDAFRHELVQLWNKETEMTIDGVVKTLAGEPRNVTLYLAVCSGYEETLSKVIVSLIDITERKWAAEELRRLNVELDRRVKERTAELEEVNKELEAFAYSVSHDLRTPLRHIDGFIELLQKKLGNASDKQARHYMDTVSDAADKMGLLIDSLLSFSRMSRRAMEFQPVVLDSLVRDVIGELEHDTAGRTIHWHIGDLPVVSGDAAMLRMVLVNLIVNAVKFTRPRKKARIEIGSLPGKNSEAVIFVRDNGVGFDMTYADKLFGVFQRLHRVDEFEGTGIGLANVRRIITRHGGRTWAKGDVDQGATFYFSLPRSIQGA